MARLPVVGGDDNAWGDILNEYLLVEHNTDGTHKFGGLLPSQIGHAGKFLTTDGTVASWASLSGGGDVTAAANFGADNRLIRSDGSGKGIQSSGISIDDANNLTGVANRTGNDVNFVTGTAGTSGNLASWNAEVDVVDSGIAVASLVTSSSTTTFTNKTVNLASNTLSGTTAQLNAALSDNDFATLAGTETLTNKTFNLASNTLTGTVAQFNSALTDGDFVVEDTSGDVTLDTGVCSGGTLTGGIIKNTTAVVAAQTYTQTADPTDHWIGSPFRAVFNVTMNDPGPFALGDYGPRGVFHVEGTVQYGANSGSSI